MSSMFVGSSDLSLIDLSSFDTSNVLDMYYKEQQDPYLLENFLHNLLKHQ